MNDYEELLESFELLKKDKAQVSVTIYKGGAAHDIILKSITFHKRALAIDWDGMSRSYPDLSAKLPDHSGWLEAKAYNAAIDKIREELGL